MVFSTCLEKHGHDRLFFRACLSHSKNLRLGTGTSYRRHRDGRADNEQGVRNLNSVHLVPGNHLDPTAQLSAHINQNLTP